MPFCNSGPSLYSQQDILYYNAFADASIFFTFHSPLYSRLRSAKENRCRPSADGMPVKPVRPDGNRFFPAALRVFLPLLRIRPGTKTPAVFLFRQSCGYTRSLLSYPPQAFPEAAESADHGHQTDFSVSRIFFRPRSRLTP